jgi:hypothetical protein
MFPAETFDTFETGTDCTKIAPVDEHTYGKTIKGKTII